MCIDAFLLHPVASPVLPRDPEIVDSTRDQSKHNERDCHAVSRNVSWGIPRKERESRDEAADCIYTGSVFKLSQIRRWQKHAPPALLTWMYPQHVYDVLPLHPLNIDNQSPQCSVLTIGVRPTDCDRNGHGGAGGSKHKRCILQILIVVYNEQDREACECD